MSPDQSSFDVLKPKRCWTDFRIFAEHFRQQNEKLDPPNFVDAPNFVVYEFPLTEWRDVPDSNLGYSRGMGVRENLQLLFSEAQ